MNGEASMSRIYNYTVYANIHWLNTGLTLNGTAEVAITAVGGQWTANPGTGMVGADGNASFLAKYGYPLPGAPEGLLVGYVGSTPPTPDAAPPSVFAVGQGTTLPAGQQGGLYLAINDDILGLYGMGFADNEGTVHVKITVG
jgi:glucose dehydrogenase